MWPGLCLVNRSQEQWSLAKRVLDMRMLSKGYNYLCYHGRAYLPYEPRLNISCETIRIIENKLFHTKTIQKKHKTNFQFEKFAFQTFVNGGMKNV